MKNKIFKITTVVLAFFTVVACKEDLLVDKVIDSTVSGGVLRNLKVTNNLDIEDGTSTFSIILEAQDEAGGNLLSEVKVNVGFNDIDNSGTDTTALSSFATIPASAFNESSPTTHRLPVATFSTTLSALVNHIGGSLSTISARDNFIIDFEMVLTDGRVFNLANATTDVTRTGRFSYFNSQFRYTATVGDPQRLVLSSISIKDNNKSGGRLANGDIDTVFFDFDGDAVTFVTAPTITRISTGGNTDDMVGSLTQVADDLDRFYILYTAGASSADTIDFIVSGGAITTGIPMVNDTLKKAYIIDNTAPSPTLGVSNVSTDATRRILNVSFELIYEALSAGTYNFQITSNSPAFDTQTISKTIVKGEQIITIDFVPQVNGVAIDEGSIDFDITTTDLKDLLGNSSMSTTNIKLGN